MTQEDVQAAIDAQVASTGEPRSYTATGAAQPITGGELWEFTTDDPDIPLSIWTPFSQDASGKVRLGIHV